MTRPPHLLQADLRADCQQAQFFAQVTQGALRALHVATTTGQRAQHHLVLEDLHLLGLARRDVPRLHAVEERTMDHIVDALTDKIPRCT